MNKKEKSELLKPGEAVVIRQEPLNLIRKMFHKNDERPVEDNWICVYYHGKFYFALLYREGYTNMFNENILERAIGSEGCELLWKDIDYWCYLKDAENILKTVMKQEGCDGLA